MKKHLTVIGLGQLSVPADQISLTFDLSIRDESYEETVALSNEQNEKLKDALEKVGLSNLKTTQFSINADYESYQDESNHYRKRFVGYLLEQSLNCTFDLDLNKLQSILSELSMTGVDPVLNISFTIKDKERVMDQLLTLATKNATDRSSVLAKAAGVELSEIINIDYKPMTSLARFESPMAVRSMAAPVVEPKDIDLEEMVTITWSIR